ncbi:hypothetical protein C8F01DRAFT_176564 [Mycena amicta]|nr:hypothetical protein C8F01DRAFT_176564 [Mycena amicta]
MDALPPELLDAVFDNFLRLGVAPSESSHDYHPDETDLPTLRACSLVCWAFRYPCQRRLLARLRLTLPMLRKQLSVQWADTEDRTYTRLASFVRDLTLVFPLFSDENDHEEGSCRASAFLSALDSLERISLCGARDLTSCRVTLPEKSSWLQSLISRPSLRRLHLSHLFFAKPRVLGDLLAMATTEVEELVLWDVQFDSDDNPDSTLAQNSFAGRFLTRVEILGTSASHAGAVFERIGKLPLTALRCDRLLPPLLLASVDTLMELTLCIADLSFLEVSIPFPATHFPTHRLHTLKIRFRCIFERYTLGVLRRLLHILDLRSLKHFHLLLEHFTDVDHVWIGLDKLLAEIEIVPAAAHILVELEDDPEWRSLNPQEAQGVRYYMESTERRGVLDVVHIAQDLLWRKLRYSRCTRRHRLH